jgi:hypothetical protein
MDVSFKIAPSLSFPARLAIGLSLAALGVASHFVAPWPLGVIVVFASSFLFLAKGYTNKPQDLGYEEWRAVTDREVDRIRDSFTRARKTKLPFYMSRGKAIVLLAVGLILALALGAGLGLPRASLVIMDFLALVSVFLISGGLSIWVPQELKMKVVCLQAIMDGNRRPGLSLVPYLRFDKTADGKEVPEDIRFMLEKKDAPADFVGVQFQVAINNGENGAVPYMYAVFLTKGRGSSYKKFSGMKARGYEVETSDDGGEYGAVVLRQQTDHGGYHTAKDDCERLYKTVLEALNS